MLANAGVTTGTPSWPDCSLEIVAAMSDVNLEGVMLGTRLAIESMARTRFPVLNPPKPLRLEAANRKARYLACTPLPLG